MVGDRNPVNKSKMVVPGVEIGSIVKVEHGEDEERGKIKRIIRQWIFHVRHGWQVVVDEDLEVKLKDSRFKVLELDYNEITGLFNFSSFILRIVVSKVQT